MTDYIIDLIEKMIISTQTLGSNTSILTQTPVTFNTNLYRGVMSIAENAVMPIGYVILGLVFLIELNNIVTRTDGQQGTMGFEIPFKLMFKFVLCKIALDSTPLILEAIFSVSNEIIMSIGGVFGANNPNVSNDIVAMKDNIEDMEFGVKLMMSVQVTMIWLIFKFSTLMINMIIIGRMIEIYVMMAIAAIPMSTLGNTELSSIGKNFLKSFTAVCVQGVLVYIVLNMYGTLVTNIETVFDPTDITSVLWEILLYSMVLVVAIFATGRISKSIFNAM